MFEVCPTTQHRRALRKIYRDFQECIWNMNIMTCGVLLVSSVIQLPSNCPALRST